MVALGCLTPLAGCGSEIESNAGSTWTGPEGNPPGVGGSGGPASGGSPNAGSSGQGTSGSNGNSGGSSGSPATGGSGPNPEGGADPGTETGGAPGEVPVDCDPTALPGTTPLRRLGRVEYVNSLRDLLTPHNLGGEVDAVSAELDQYPPDGENADLFSGIDRRLSQRHVDALHAVADALAGRISGDAGSLAALAGDCAGDDPPSSACVSGFVESFGRRAFRRPLSSDEVARYVALSDGTTTADDAFFSVLYTFFMSPEFLYHLEIGSEAAGSEPAAHPLGAHDLASRLSYLFWQSMPDEELLAAADSGALGGDTEYAAAVERVFSDPRTQPTLRGFFAEWLEIAGFAGFVDNAAFRAFAEGVETGADLHAAMTDEAHALIDHFVWDAGGSYADVLTSRLFFGTSPELAALYGVSPWDGQSTPPSLPEAERSGLLSRAALLVEGNEVTNPVKRGVFVLRNLLCESIDPPSDLPAEALSLPEVDPGLSTRQRFEIKTSSIECAGCHTRINPYGFSLEAYDALGRFRTEERIYDDEGELVATQPVDPAVNISLDGVATDVGSVAEMSALLAASPVAHECLARQYFRFSMRRYETAGDSCAIEAVRDRLLASGGSLRDALRSIALDPAFRQRVPETEEP